MNSSARNVKSQGIFNRPQLQKSLLTFSSFLGALTLFSACSQNSSLPQIPADSFTAVPTDIKATISADDLSLMRQMGEGMPATGQLVWLKKDVWIGRKVWITLGVERSSLTGLAMSVMGYIPAEITKVGGELVILRQNKGLFGGSTLGPDLVINSYPIISDREGSLLVDFSAAKSPYGLSTIGFYDGMSANEEIQPRVEFTRAVQATENRVSFVNVIVAKSPDALYEADSSTAEALAGLDPYSLAATFRTDWVTEIQSPEFNPLAVSDSVFGFFIGAPLVIESGTAVEEFVNKINTNKQMMWTLSSNTPADYADAVKQGVLAWNQSFGKEALTVQMGRPDELSYTNPETSNVVWDDNQAVGMAFANWRSHPYTGEIVQAQVYMSGSMWAESGKMLHKMRMIEKQIRAELAQKPIVTPTPPVEGIVSPLSSDGTLSPTIPAPDSSARFAQVKRNLKLLLRDSKSLAEREEKQLQKQGVRRFMFGFNRALTKTYAKHSPSCFKLTPAASELRKQSKALDKLLADLNSGNAEATVMIGADVPALANVVGPTLGGVLPASGDEITHNPYPDESISVDDFSKNVVRGVVMHEVGHAIGLRHNFIGSMETNDDPTVESASIMDYNDLVVDANFEKPGTNDTVVLTGVYGTPEEKANLKDIRFCSDEIAGRGFPGCTRFDYGKNNLDGFRVQQEANLHLANRLLTVGQMDAGFEHLNRAITNNMPVINYVVFPSDLGSMFLRDANFVAKQRQALEQFRSAQNMFGVDFPAPLKEVYAQILVQALASAITERTFESELFKDVLEVMVSTITDQSGAMELTTRMEAIKGLHNFQDMSGRLAMTELRNALKLRLSSPASSPDAQMEDEEVLTAIENILSKGYFKEAR